MLFESASTNQQEVPKDACHPLQLDYSPGFHSFCRIFPHRINPTWDGADLNCKKR
jgi:hypothetical protein